MTGRTPFSAVMLAGGAGRRMGGVDKASVEVGGLALAEHVRRAAVAAGAAELLAVGGDAARLAAMGWRTVADQWPAQGPLGGLVTALGAATHDHVLVVACDLPALDPTLLGAVLDALAADPCADAAVPEVDGHLQVLHAAYRRRARPVLAAAFERGTRSLTAAVGGLRTRIVALEPSPALADVDTPDDLRRITGEAGD